MCENEMYASLARQMTMEYFKQNNLFPKAKEQIDDSVKEFAEIETAFYKSLLSHKTQFTKLANYPR